MASVLLASEGKGGKKVHKEKFRDEENGTREQYFDMTRKKKSEYSSSIGKSSVCNIYLYTKRNLLEHFNFSVRTSTSAQNPSTQFLICLHVGVNFLFAIVHYLPFTEKRGENFSFVRYVGVYARKKNIIFSYTRFEEWSRVQESRDRPFGIQTENKRKIKVGVETGRRETLKHFWHFLKSSLPLCRNVALFSNRPHLLARNIGALWVRVDRYWMQLKGCRLEETFVRLNNVFNVCSS